MESTEFVDFLYSKAAPSRETVHRTHTKIPGRTRPVRKAGHGKQSTDDFTSRKAQSAQILK